MKWYQLLTAIVVAFGAQAQAAPVQLNGAGATFIYPVFSQWTATYHQATGHQLNYQAIGSGGGIRQIIQGTVDFAATDAPLTEAELQQGNLVQFPVIMGGIIPVINVPGIKANELRLDGTTLADIFAGKISHWDDTRIKALNPSLTLPKLAITVVHRADGSGSTWILTNYLSKVSESWKKDIGNDKSVQWPKGVGAKGNDAVANYVMRIKGGIGYVELAYVLQNNMTSVQLKNQAGNFVSPTLDNLKAAAAHADWMNTPGFAVILTDQPGANSWPITGATFMLLHAPASSDANKVLRDFFIWSWNEGSAKAEELAYVPLPASLVEVIATSWRNEGVK